MLVNQILFPLLTQVVLCAAFQEKYSFLVDARNLVAM